MQENATTIESMNFVSANSSNRSSVRRGRPSTNQQWSTDWNLDSVVTLVICVLAFLFNLIVFVAILSKRSLRSVPFSVYQMHLTFVNILYILIHDPLHIISTVDGVWWMGDALCNLYQYAVHIVCAATTHTHLLITFNRIWAIAFPFAYRTRHSIGTAAGFCFGMWVYLNALLLPRNVMDWLYYRLPLLNHGCNMNFGAQRTFSIVLQFIVFDMPAIVMVTSYPYICYRHLQTNKIETHPDSNAKKKSTTYQFNADDQSRHPNHLSVLAKAVITKRNHGFLVLSWLTMSVLICWVPLLAYYSIRLFVTFDLPALLKVADILYNLQIVFDPVILVFAQSSLRNVFINK